MADWREIEKALEEFFRARKIPVGPGFGNPHIVVATSCARGGGGDLLAGCPFMAQIGENCGMGHGRLDLSDLAKHLAEIDR